ADDADEPVISLSATEAAVFDIVYAPLETPLLRHARQAGLRTIDGLEMLVRQAVPGFLQWSGGAQPSIQDARMVCLETIKARQNG
ncbi:MAG: shikimate dehydrogenase, partial [Pseudomonadota bacterium]